MHIRKKGTEIIYEKIANMVKHIYITDEVVYTTRTSACGSAVQCHYQIYHLVCKNYLLYKSL